MSAAGTAIIHFVGLVVFMTQPPSIMLKTSSAKMSKVRPAVLSPARAIAVLPKVERFGSGMNRVGRAKDDTPSLAEQAALIETHTALVAFRESDYIASPGWTPAPLWTETDVQGNELARWKYIALFGDRLTFQTGIVSDQPISLQGVPLPHITDQVGGSNHALIPGYQSPYPLAAAVIELPVGTLTPCLSLAPGVTKRTDTEVTAANNGQLTIASETGKSLTLKGNARVFVGNVPLAYAQHTSMSGSPGHYLVYCAMTNGTQCNPPSARPTEQLAGGTPNCGMNTMVTIPEDAKVVIDPGPFHLLNLECSNTQWP